MDTSVATFSLSLAPSSSRASSRGWCLRRTNSTGAGEPRRVTSTPGLFREPTAGWGLEFRVEFRVAAPRPMAPAEYVVAGGSNTLQKNITVLSKKNAGRGELWSPSMAM